MPKARAALVTNPNEKKLANLRPFQPGQVGNPVGRPKGSRNKLGEAFLAALHDDFERDGVAAITATREQHPEQYVRVIASLLPKEFKIETVSDLTDEQLDARIRTLANLVEVGISPASGRGEAAQGSKALN
jgi:hypothetical protein